MTEPEGDGRAISVAELLARNGQRVGAGGGGRRRRGVKGGISVAELTGEFAPVRLPREGEADDADASADVTPADAPPADTAPEPAADATAAEETAGDGSPAEPESRDEVTDEADEPEADKSDEPEADKSDEPAAEVDEKAPDAEADEKTRAEADAKDGEKAAAAPTAPEAPTAPDAPTVVAPAVAAVDAQADAKADAKAPADAAETTVLPTVPRLAPIAQHEPRLLAGQTPGGEVPVAVPPAPIADEAVTDPAADGADDGADDDFEPEPSNAKQWAILLGQGAVAVVAGALMFKGFERLWDMLPMVALVLAVLVIVGLVAMVRILRRTDDIASLVIAVVAGVFVTLGPLAFLLSTS